MSRTEIITYIQYYITIYIYTNLLTIYIAVFYTKAHEMGLMVLGWSLALISRNCACRKQPLKCVIFTREKK